MDIIDLPKTWANQEILSLAKAQCKTFKNRKISEAEKEGISDSGIFKSQSKSISLTELVSIDISNILGKPEISGIASMNQAFQAYSISLYDMIKDNHFIRNGKPTFLKIYGKEYVHEIEEKYNNIFNRLSSELEDAGVANARKISNEQYIETLRMDSFRNENPVDKDINYSIFVQESISGMQTSKIALLLNSPGKLEFLCFYFGNALSTLDDLIDFFSEDFKNPKLTIPIAYFEKEFGPLGSMSIEEISKKFIQSNSMKNTKQYILHNLEKAKFILEETHETRETLISLMNSEMINFLNRFPEKYI